MPLQPPPELESTAPPAAAAPPAAPGASSLRPPPELEAATETETPPGSEGPGWTEIKGEEAEPEVWKNYPPKMREFLQHVRPYVQAGRKAVGIVNPGAALSQRLRSEVTPGAAFWGSGVESLPIAGNLPQRGYEAAAGKFHDITGKGPTAEQQRAADEEYEKQLTETYPGMGMAGTAAGVGTTIGASMALGAPAALSRIPGLGKYAEPAARVLWQSLLGGGIGASTGFTTGEGLADRYQRAKNYGILGTALGGIGGVIGEGITGLFGKPVSREVAQAAKAAKVSPYTKAGSQSEAIGEAIRAPGLEPETGEIFGPGGFNEQVHGTVTQHARALEDAAVAMKHQALTKGAMVSPDAFSALRQKLTDGLAERGIDIKDIPTLPALSKARRAMSLFDRLDTAAKQAAQAGKEIGLKEIEQTHQLINGVGREASGEYDPVVGLLQKNYDQWMHDTIDAHLFSGDPSALQDLMQWRKMWGGYKDFISGPNALANIIKKSATGEHVANYFDAVTKLGHGQEGAKLAESLKPLLGEHEWDMLRGLTLNKFVASAEGAEMSGPQLAKNLQKMLDMPASRVLFSPEELKQWNSLAIAVRAMPKGSEGFRTLLGFGVGGAEGALEGLAEALKERGEEGFNPYALATTIGTRAVIGLALAKFGPGLVRNLGPAAASAVAPVGVAATANTPALSEAIGHARGGSVQRALSVARTQARRTDQPQIGL